MKRYSIEIIMLSAQFYMFYIFPLLVENIDTMELAIIMLISTLILSTLNTIFSENRTKYLYPFIISMMFIPSVFIHYSKKALIQILWYLIIAHMGTLIGIILDRITSKNKKTI